MSKISNDQVTQLAEVVKNSGNTFYGMGNGVGQVAAPKYATNTLDAKPARQNLVQKLGAIGSQAAHITGDIVKTGANFVKNTPKYVYQGVQPFLQGVADVATGNSARDLKNINDQRAQLDRNQQTYMDLYKSGKMDKENYVRLMQDLSASYSELSKGAQKVATQADRGNVVESAAMTAATILAGGRLQTQASSPVVAARALQSGGKAELKTLIDSQATNLEKLATKLPAVRSLVLRNTETLAKQGIKQLPGESEAQFITRAGKDLAVGMLLKRPIVYQMNIGSAEKIYNNLLDGDNSNAIKESAWVATQLINGGPLGAALKGGSWIKGKIGKLAYGKDSVIDNLSREIGDYTPTQIGNYLQGLDRNSSEFRQAEKIFRIMQETNLRVADEDVTTAVKNILSNYDHANVPRTEITPQKLVEDYANWHAAAQEIKGLSKVKGLTPEQVDNLVVVRWDSVMKRGLANAIEGAGNDRNAMSQALTDFAKQTTNGWSNNPTLMAQLTRIIDEAASAEEAARRIKSIPTALAIPDNIPKSVANRLAKLGYGVAVPEGGFRKTPTVDYEDTRKLISNSTSKEAADTLFDPATAPTPVLGSVASGLEKAGLSPRGASRVASQQLAESVTATLEKVGVARGLGFSKDGREVRGGQVILSKLQEYVNQQEATTIGKVITLGKARPALTDIRQLTIGEIKKAVGVTKSEAKEISKAVMNGYLDTPLEYRGLGDKMVDYAFRYNPLQKYYSRIQSALRYSYNPFFAAQEGVETAAFAGLSGGNRLTNLTSNHLLWNRSRAELNTAVKTLDDAQIFSSSFSGEAAQDMVLGRLSANITNAQKRDLAGLALDIAKNQGKDLATMARDNPDQLADALRVVVQYPNKGFLASSMARTLNVAFFPMRYNLKVTKMAAEILAKQPAPIQLAVTHSLLNLKDWLKSDEGIQWQSRNADALQVFNWITPMNSITSVMHLLNGKPDSIGELGQLGGLPFGVISQILDSQGIIHLNTPYVNPKTGDVFPRYIPETTKAKAAVAIQDILGSMFTYPGRILGLPGKQESLNKLVRSLPTMDTNGSDFTKQDQVANLTPLERNWVRVLKGDTSKEAVDSLYNAPVPGNFQWYTLPPLNVPSTVDVTTRQEVAASKRSTKRQKKTAKPVGQF